MKNICKLLKNARRNIILKYNGELIWRDTESDYIEDLIRTHLQDNGYTTPDLQGDAPDLDDSQLRDFQLTTRRILEDLSHVYDGNILCYSHQYLEHFTDYHLDIDSILSYYYGDKFLAYYATQNITELNTDYPTCSSTLIEVLCNEAWRCVIRDYELALLTDRAKELLNQQED